MVATTTNSRATVTTKNLKVVVLNNFTVANNNNRAKVVDTVDKMVAMVKLGVPNSIVPTVVVDNKVKVVECLRVSHFFLIFLIFWTLDRTPEPLYLYHWKREERKMWSDLHIF